MVFKKIFSRFRNAHTIMIMETLILLLVLWISIFLYGSFYYAYMPTVAHVRPVYLQYSTCPEVDIGKPGCTYPEANVTLLDKPLHGRQLLMRGQSYRIFVDLEMPQSPVNENLGMFMVKISFYSDGGEVTSVSSRPAVLHFRSLLLKILDTLFFAPFLLGGYSEEKQMLEVELFDKFQDSPYKPVIGAVIEIHARRIEVYSSVLRIQAHFTGLRYLMFNWPILTAVVGVSTNFMILITVTLLTWMRWFYGGEEEEQVVRVRFDEPLNFADFEITSHRTGRAALEEPLQDPELLPQQQPAPEQSGIATTTVPGSQDHGLHPARTEPVDTLTPVQGHDTASGSSDSGASSDSFEKIDPSAELLEPKEPSDMTLLSEGSHLRMRDVHDD
ncbi:seipin-like isoform X1 [Ptychodera flava]|uniref:seipin-like isoform X1 n=1 Tax=Ptychodera flava TaxID=63121 RepID=UPI00396A2B45